MGRKSAGPWWNESKQAYYVQHGGKQHRLSNDHETALLQWAALTQRGRGGRTVADVLASYIDGRDCGDRTRRVMRDYAALINAGIGPIAVDKLTVATVRRLLDKPSWGYNTRQYVTRLIKSACKHFDVDIGLRVGKVRSRGEAAMVPDATRQALRGLVPKPLGVAIIMLDDTGCRPSEMCRVTAADIDTRRGCWRLAHHKTTHETGADRLIYLTPAALAYTLRAAAAHPDGPLFRNNNGGPWTPAALHKATVLTCGRLKVPRTFPYAFRHTFATRLLKADVSPSKVAALLGHAGIGMLYAHYSHLLTDADSMHAALRAVDGAA